LIVFTPIPTFPHRGRRKAKHFPRGGNRKGGKKCINGEFVRIRKIANTNFISDFKFTQN
jgi:hypothetical protein